MLPAATAPAPRAPPRAWHGATATATPETPRPSPPAPPASAPGRPAAAASRPRPRPPSGPSCASQTRSIVSSGVSPSKGLRPVSSSCSVMPSEKKSLAGLSAPPRTCSGDMYAYVPLRTPLRVVSRSSVALAMPKSASFTSPSRDTSTLAGVTSRCTTPERPAARHPSARAPRPAPAPAHRRCSSASGVPGQRPGRAGVARSAPST